MIFKVPKHMHFGGYDSVIKDTLHHFAHMQYHSWISDDLKPSDPFFYFLELILSPVNFLFM